MKSESRSPVSGVEGAIYPVGSRWQGRTSNYTYPIGRTRTLKGFVLTPCHFIRYKNACLPRTVEEVINPMQKGLCITALAISVIVFVLFFVDLLAGLFGLSGIAPFKGANMLISIVFSICSAVLGVLSWFTLKEQVWHATQVACEFQFEFHSMLSN